MTEEAHEVTLMGPEASQVHWRAKENRFCRTQLVPQIARLYAVKGIVRENQQLELHLKATGNHCNLPSRGLIFPLLSCYSLDQQ